MSEGKRTVRIELGEDELGDLAACMAAMPSMDENGDLRAVTMSMTVREALRQMAERDKKGMAR